MHHCIKYRLTAEGTVPSFLCLHPEGVGGVFVASDPSTPSPRDMVMIGLSEDDNLGDAEVISTKAELQAYLESIGAEWVIPATTPDSTSIPFDPVAATNWAWNRLDALNATV